MQGKTLLKLLSGLTALSIATPALAIMSVPYGWYLEGNLGSTHTSNTNYPGSTSTSGIGGNANLGYKFMPYVAAEMGFTQYSNSTIKGNGGSIYSNTKAAHIKNYSYDLAIRGIVPIAASGFELFAKLGVERVNARVSVDSQNAANALGISASNHSATGLYVGAGAQYYVMPELALNVQWQRANGNSKTGNMDLFSGGISFIFD